MEFFATFWSWLNGQLATYVGDNTARVAAALEPAVVTLGTLYVMTWGYLQLTGRIEEPFSLGLKRLITLAVVLGVALRLWLYNTIIVDTFYQAPAQLAAVIVGSDDPIKTIDSIWAQGGSVADSLFNNGSIYSLDPGFFLAGLVVWVLVGLLCVYTMFLIALSHVALAILLALGPLFFAMLLFESTRRLFDAWLAQLANYALITVLTVMSCALLLQIVKSFATQTAARGSAIATVDALNMVLVSVLVFLFMRQVMPIASSIANGAALNTFRSLSGAMNWGARAGTSILYTGARNAAALLARGPGT
jgi:type IV secretion system protein VirB6